MSNYLCKNQLKSGCQSFVPKKVLSRIDAGHDAGGLCETQGAKDHQEVRQLPEIVRRPTLGGEVPVRVPNKSSVSHGNTPLTVVSRSLSLRWLA